ncbi:MAG: PAS domain-containing protein [Magnetococcales bacterium]|nr:PAS domain-containing protein [Magnetococcales bacterium]
MTGLAAWVSRRKALAWVGIVALSVIMAGTTGEYLCREHERARLIHLGTKVERAALELLSLTLNGSAMGSVAMLGLIDPKIKRDAMQKDPPNDPELLRRLESVGLPYEAEGVFVVNGTGRVHSSWDNAGRPSTGIDVRFRPYFQRAMQGQSSIYAAISLATNRRAIYFAAPVFAEPVASSERIGAMVSRTGPDKIDRLLADLSDWSLLLSPQGVVFAASRSEWIGLLAGTPTPERVQAIRELKQFGKLFEEQQPDPLPMSVEPGVIVFEGRRHAVASSRVTWNDPYGDWLVVLGEDLTRTIPLSWRVREMVVAGVASFLMLVLILILLRGHHAQDLATAKLHAYATHQEESAGRKSRLAQASVRMQQAKGIEDLGQIFLRDSHVLLGMMQGVIYAYYTPGCDVMRLAARFACNRDLPERLLPGQGLLGQCCLERRVLTFAAPAGHLEIVRSGLGEMRPAQVALMPVLLNDLVLGVVEMAFVDRSRFEESADLRAEMVAMLALNLEIQRRNRDAEQLLSATTRAERTMASQLALHQALVNTLPYPIFYKGMDGGFLGCNRAFSESFQVEQAQLLGQKVAQLTLFPESECKAFQHDDERIMTDGSVVRREILLPFADGSIRETLYYASGFRLPDGSSGGILGSFVDISELRATERKLMRMSDRGFKSLAKSCEERIRVLQNEVNAFALAAGQPPPYSLRAES